RRTEGSAGLLTSNASGRRPTMSVPAGNANKAEPADRDIAMVFQNYALYPNMTVSGNLEYGLKNRGTERAEINRRVA
ncbi:hypothetical protein ACC754_44320, partial [Rhizobium johnstonii]